MSKVYKIIGYLWSEDPHYSDWDKDHKFPQYDRLSKSESLIEADSIEECMLWAIDYIPDELIGIHIQCMTHDSREFFSGANKSYWVYELGTDEDDKICYILAKGYKEYAKSAQNDYDVRELTRGLEGISSWHSMK